MDPLLTTLIAVGAAGAGLAGGRLLDAARRARAEREAAALRAEAEGLRQRIAELGAALGRLLDPGTRRIEDAVRAVQDAVRGRGDAGAALASQLQDLQRAAEARRRGADGAGAAAGGTEARPAERAEEILEAQSVHARALGDEAEQLATTAGQASNASAGIARRLRAIDGESSNLTQAASETARFTAQVDDSLHRVQGGAAETTQISARVSAEAERGYKAVHKTLDEIERIRDLTQTARQRIDALGARVVGIGDVVRVIQEIAEKTNLLALNASIIAAQAGEHGRGFAVVAQEIKALAQRTAASTKQIGDQIRGVQEESERAIEAMANGVTAVGEGFQVALGAGDALGEIRQSARLAQKKVQSITRAMDEQAAASQRVAELAGQLASRASSLAGAVRDEAARGEDIRGLVETVAAAAARISTVAREQTEGNRSLAEAVADLKAEAAALERCQRELGKQAARIQEGSASVEGADDQIALRLTEVDVATGQLREELARIHS